ncbi:MAG: hypothetical protein AAGJ46_14925 [Planctomycetota bacterium]
MLKALMKRLAEWTGDRHLDMAIRRELRRLKLGSASIRVHDLRLIAIQRPGWVQVRQFLVDTTDADKQPVTMLGLSRDDGRESKIDVLLTRDSALYRQRQTAWCEGLIRRGG